MELIISEKATAARRIADILSDGAADHERLGGVPVYSWADTRCIGLSGHVVGVDFPDAYADWSAVDPAELVDADIVTTPTQPTIIRELKRLVRDADRVVIATDYDREGELIGKETYELVREVDETVPIDRVRFSAITATEVQAAFEDPDDLDFDLAAAGEARRIIDLMWGAALTRFLSLAAKQYGDDFISVGRVQSPALKLLVDREREIEAFEPEDYWELFAELESDDDGFEAQYYYRDADDNEAERIWTEADADAVASVLAGASTATVTTVDRRTRTDRPPAPFNTTQFIRAAGAVGVSPKRAMAIAEDLYTAGYITYPRTDNQVYPAELDPVALLAIFAEIPPFRDDAQSLLSQETISPTRGGSDTTDHPPIHPTGDIPDRGTLSGAKWRIYELIVRRFFATVAPAATWKHLRVVVSAAGLGLKANGQRLVSPGYHAVYPYFSTAENELPDVAEGDELRVVDTRLEAKQTEPPRRFGQPRLIETMADRDLGTKATRHEIVDKLYDRGYVEGDPPEPTGLARGVIEAAEEYADLVVSEQMTADLEADMTAIANGERTLQGVTTESRELLKRVFTELESSEDAIGARIQRAFKRDKALGPCPDCGEFLLVRTNNRGSHFVGCDGYPDCEFTLPLPDNGTPRPLEETCQEHGLAHVKMFQGKGTFVHGCPQCQARAATETPDRVIGECPECHATDGGELAIKTVRSGSRLVGCTRYPACEYSLPLPRRGDIEITDEYCQEHDLPGLIVHASGDPWELGCPICNYREYKADQGAQDGLEAIHGIGEKTASKLAAAGVETLDDLLDADAEAVADDVTGVSADQVQDWQARANAA